MTQKKRIIYTVLGPVLYIVVFLLLPDSIFHSSSSKFAVASVAWMAFWWVTGPVDYAITGLLPIAINAIIPMTEMKLVIENYSSETIMLLLGASMLVISWEMTGLDKRVAVRLLGYIGDNYRINLIFWFFLSMILSTILPNAVVCATVTPLAVALLKFVGEGDIRNSHKGAKLLLYIAYATGVGGLASPLGGAMNLVTVEYLQQISNSEYYYYSWVIRFLPIMVALIIICLYFMLRDTDSDEILGKTKEYYSIQNSKLGKISSSEKKVFLLFIIAVILSFTRKLYSDLLPGLKPAYVFIICAICAFPISNNNGDKILNWNSIKGKIEWEMIFIFSGGLALGTLMSNSGAIKDIGDAISNTGISSDFLLVSLILIVSLLLSDVTSNTATAAVVMPIVMTITKGISKNPIPYIYIASIGVNLSFVLPTSIRAIPVGYGLDPKYMMKEGVKISICVAIVMIILAYALMCHWDMFNTI